jgi:hypothetical protein
MPDGLSITTGGLFSAQGLSLVTGGLFSTSIDASLHPRTRIRQYVVAKLKAAATVAAERVHSERVDPLQASDDWELPALNIFTRDESADEWSKSPRTLRRVVELAIDIVADGKTVEDLVDESAKVVEAIVGTDIYLGQWADDTVLRSTETSFDGTGAKKIGVARLVFAVTYASEVSVEPSDLLLRIQNEWNLSHPDAQAEAEDVVEFEEP